MCSLRVRFSTYCSFAHDRLSLICLVIYASGYVLLREGLQGGAHGLGMLRFADCMPLCVSETVCFKSTLLFYHLFHFLFHYVILFSSLLLARINKCNELKKTRLRSLGTVVTRSQSQRNNSYSE